MHFLKSVHDKSGIFDDLQCPSNWDLDTLLTSPTSWEVLSDRLKIEALPWNTLIGKVVLAHIASVQFENILLCRKLITECYLLLMSIVNNTCDIVRKYAKGIKHVVDSCWAFSLLHESGKSSNHPPQDVLEFAASITPFKTMGQQQKSAVLMMKGIVTGNRDIMTSAIDMYPQEGQWHCDFGLWLASNAAVSMGELLVALKAFESAMRLRYNEKCVYICNVLLRLGTRNACLRSMQLMRHFLDSHPDSVHVLLAAAKYFCEVESPCQDLALAETCYRKAVSKASDCITVGALFGSFLLNIGKIDEALLNFEKGIMSTKPFGTF